MAFFMHHRLALLVCFLCMCSQLDLHALLDTLSLSGNPGTLTIAVPAAGSQPAAVVDSSTTYSVISLLTSRRITGQLIAAMPTGLTLQVQLQATAPATSVGKVTLSTTAQNLVTGIPALLSLQLGGTITYTLSATVNATPVASGSVTVTYTLTS